MIDGVEAILTALIEREKAENNLWRLINMEGLFLHKEGSFQFTSVRSMRTVFYQIYPAGTREFPFGGYKEIFLVETDTGSFLEARHVQWDCLGDILSKNVFRPVISVEAQQAVEAYQEVNDIGY